MSEETTRGPLGEMVEGDFLRDLVRARAEKTGGGRRDDIGESRIARIRREPRAETRGGEVTRDAMRLTNACVSGRACVVRR